MSDIHELSSIWAEQNPNPAEQRRRILALITAGADLHATDKNGVTALHHAVRFRMTPSSRFSRAASSDETANAEPSRSRGVIVTSPGRTSDFVSRFFAPNYGEDEDPVTGSARCTLAPYWAVRLGKSTLSARQLSKRTGTLRCRVEGERVFDKVQDKVSSSGVQADRTTDASRTPSKDSRT